MLNFNHTAISTFVNLILVAYYEQKCYIMILAELVLMSPTILRKENNVGQFKNFNMPLVLL